MAKTSTRPKGGVHRSLHTQIINCPACRRAMWSAYTSDRTVVTLRGVQHLRLHVRRCQNPACPRYHRPYRPEEEGRLALPAQAFGLDVIALVGALRYQQHRSVPEIHQELRGRGLDICERTVTNLLDRYEELLAVRLSDSARLGRLLGKRGRVVLAIDGLQPDVGHEVLWVLRDCLSGQVLMARSLLSSTQADLAALLGEVKAALSESAPICGAVSDGQRSIRNAVAAALPGVPHQLCQFHYLREAARPIYELDRHAKKQLKKRVRNIRPLERRAQGKSDEQSRAVLGYCSAVRSALTDDGRPPLEASGLKLHRRLEAIHASLERVEEKGGCPPGSRSSKPAWSGG